MISIASPLAGWVTPLDEVPDPVFADRMLGDGVAIDPTDGRLVALGDGTIESVHPAGHAVTSALDAGTVLLLHIGQIGRHTSELQPLMRNSSDVFCLKKKNN